MTTIAWDGETLAADSQVSAGGIICGPVKKIVKIKGSWLAHAGDLSEFEAFKEWFRNGQIPGEKPKINEDGFTCVLLNSKGIWEYEYKLFPFKVRSQEAWGSGAHLAIAVMDHGGTATEAVKYATTRDVWSGGRVQSVKKPK